MATYIRAVMAGICISIGGAVYLMTSNPVVGALLFAVGLFCVCVFGLNLFTGKVCYVLEQDAAYARRLPVIWLGNLTGAVIIGLLSGITSFGPQMAEKAATMSAAKLAQTPLSAFTLAVMCNMLIYIAVEGYKHIPHEIGKYLAIIFGVVVFIVSGYEHCVANMYYFTVAGAWSLHAVGYLLLMTLGNAVGGILFPLLFKIEAHFLNGAK